MKNVKFLLVLMVLFANCQKNIDVENHATQPSVAATNPQTLLDESEKFGKLVYDHMKFRFLSHKPEDYVNPAIREAALKETNRIKADFKGLSVEQGIQKQLTAKNMTTKQADYFRTLDKTIHDVSYSMSDVRELDNALHSFDATLAADTTLSDAQKLPILYGSASVRRYVDYRVEFGEKPDGGAVGLRDGCILGAKTSCWATNLISAAISTLSAPNGGIQIAVGIISSIAAVISIYTNDSCRCGSRETGVSCYTLNGITVFFDQTPDCNSSNNIRFVAYGTGPTPGSFEWGLSKITDKGGLIIPPSIWGGFTSNPYFGVALGSDLSQWYRLTVTVTNTCTGPVTQTFDFTINEVLGEVGDMLISGPYDNYLNGNSIFYLNGACIANSNNTFLWNQPSAGQIVGANNTTQVTVHFTTRSCFNYNGWTTSCFPVYIVANATNTCPNSTNNSVGDAKSIIVH